MTDDEIVLAQDADETITEEQPLIDSPEPEVETQATEEQPADQPEDEPKSSTEGKKKNSNGWKRKNARLERENAELRAKLTPQSTATLEDTRPTRNNYHSDDDYVEAVADWKVDQKLRAIDQQKIEAKAAAERAKAAQDWQDKVDNLGEEYDDFDEKIASCTIPLGMKLEQAIVDSDYAPQIAYYLAENPSKIEEIRGLSIQKIVKEIEMLEDKLSGRKSPEPQVRKPAPAPINPVKGTSPVASTDYKKMTTEQYYEARQAELRSKRR